MIRPCLLAALSCASCASLGRTVTRESSHEQARVEVAKQATATVSVEAKATTRGRSTRTVRTPTPVGEVFDVTVVEWGTESGASTTASSTGMALATVARTSESDVVSTKRPWWAPVAWWALGAGLLGAATWWAYKRIAGRWLP